MSMTLGYRLTLPRGFDSVRWRSVRIRWNAAADVRGQTTELRRALAAEIGLSYTRLQRWAKRSGWIIHAHNG